MYTRLCKGLDDYGKLIPANQNIYKYIKDLKQDYYTSVYKYNETHKKQFDKTGSVAGIQDVVTNDLVFDFDSKNLEEARRDTLETINRLNKYGLSIDDINIYYSGSKGFHLILNTDSTLTPNEAKNIAINIAGDLPTFDSRVYNSNRIFRVAFTRHPETNLYKIPINYDELSEAQISDIKATAKDEYETEEPIKTKLPKAILELKKAPKKEEKEDTKPLTSELDLSQKPDNLSPWKYALSQGFFPPGQRSNAFDIMARTYKALGHDKVETYHLLKSMREKQASRYGQSKFDKDEMYKNVVEQAFSSHSMGGTYSEDHFPEQLKKHLEDLGVPRKEFAEAIEAVTPMDKALKEFNNYALNIDDNLLSFGFPELDKILKVQLGQLHAVLAPPGVGKTSAALTILNNTSKSGMKALFASYDMYENILIQKLVMRETGWSDEKIFNVYRKYKESNRTCKESKKLIDWFGDLVSKAFGNISFCFKSGQTIPELRKTIEYEEQRLGESIPLVVVDYLELIRTKASDPTQATMEAIQGLREIANDMHKVVLVLLQPNKASSIVDEPILSYNAAKGSSAVAAAVTAMITMHRPGMSSTNTKLDKWLSMNIVKNRMGPLGQVDFAWEGQRGLIREMDDMERQLLATFRMQKKEEKEKDKDDDFI